MKSLVSYEFPASSTISEKLASKLDDKTYRHEYMVEGVKTWVARQVRALREQREWSQADTARETGKKQSAISRIEDPDYGKLSLQTLFDLASAFDLPLVVQFTEWKDWLERMDDVSVEALEQDGFSKDQLAGFSTQQFVANVADREAVAVNNIVQIASPIRMQSGYSAFPIVETYSRELLAENLNSWHLDLLTVHADQFVSGGFQESVFDEAPEDILEMPDACVIQSVEHRRG